MIEVRKTANGGVSARRSDGLPLTPEDREAAKAIATAEEQPLRAKVAEEIQTKDGTLSAILIYSDVLEDDLWVIFDRSFEPKDNLAVYYAEEIPLLKGKSLEDLREIHKVKLAFPGCRVIQEAAEKQKAEQGKLNVMG